MLREVVVYGTSTTLRFSPVSDCLDTEGCEGEQHLLDIGLVHGLQTGGVEFQKPLLHNLEILRAEMTNDCFLTSFEPAFAVAHKQIGVAEMLFECNLTYRGRRGWSTDFRQTGNGHRISPSRVTVFKYGDYVKALESQREFAFF